MSAVTSHPDAPVTRGGAPVRVRPDADRGERAGQSRRAPLSVVPAGPGRRRTPFVVFCFLVLAAALVAVLVLNINVSGGQYDLIRLRNQQTALTEENQALTAKVENNTAPQNLAARAAKAGMVPAPAPGYINLHALTVSGKPTAAVKKDTPKVAIPAPAVPGAPVSGDAKAKAKDAGSATQKKTTETPKPQQVDLHGGSIEAPRQKGQ